MSSNDPYKPSRAYTLEHVFQSSPTHDSVLTLDVGREGQRCLSLNGKRVTHKSWPRLADLIEAKYRD